MTDAKAAGAALIKMQAPQNGDPAGAGYYAADQTTREAGFALRHPVAAWHIGTVRSGSQNISTRAVRFSTNDLGLESRDSREGSEVNAFRHALWQAKITEEFGEQIAHEAGNAHESNPFAIGGSNRKVTNFKTESEADESADLRNNEIGRGIGSANDGMEMRELSLEVLSEFHKNGLWVSEEQEDGTHSVVKRRISTEKYEKARRRLLELNQNGYDPVQQASREAE